MKLIVIPLFILIMMGVMSQLLMETDIDFSYNGTTPEIDVTQQTGNWFLYGGAIAYFDRSTSSVVAFDINMMSGFIAIITGLVAVGALAGLHIVGSGLSDYSVQVVHKAIIYYTLWSVFSGLAIGSIFLIPMFGVLFWFLLTVFYSLGFFQTLNGGSGGS